MRGYWAEIDEDRIVIYSSHYLARYNRLRQLEDMREHYWRYQREVILPNERIITLERGGVKVLTGSFKTLEGRWHWFTGYSKGDAFRLTSRIKQIVSENGFFEIKFAFDFSHSHSRTSALVSATSSYGRKIFDKRTPSILPTEKFRIKSILKKIRKEFKNTIVDMKIFPEKPPNFAMRDLNLTDAIKESLKRQGIKKLYIHQAKVIEKALNGRNVVISTPTASGKTLCFNIPVLDTIIRNGNSRALYIYPRAPFLWIEVELIYKVEQR
ncbi:DEAD/DEAH box helicase [Candidatus Bathyarchaeota archaeon]|nr:DEAD/DEAH box helicase [Candidatus Bathyarchaeota archaeon]